MTYTTFIQQVKEIGKEAVILMVGKRQVAGEDEQDLTHVASHLARNLPDVFFRSGNAKGADELFAAGVQQVSSERLQLVLPYANHRQVGRNERSSYYALDPEQMAEEDPIPYMTMQHHKNSRNSIPAYLAGERGRKAMKAPFLLRDTLMVIGDEAMGLRKADFAIYYDDLNKPLSGGTGLTIRLCREQGILSLNQQTWMPWLSE